MRKTVAYEVFGKILGRLSLQRGLFEQGVPSSCESVKNRSIRVLFTGGTPC
jgi:hypothetical protein